MKLDDSSHPKCGNPIQVAAKSPQLVSSSMNLVERILRGHMNTRDESGIKVVLAALRTSASASATRYLQLSGCGIAAVISGNGQPWIVTSNLVNRWIYEPNPDVCWVLTALIGHQNCSGRDVVAAHRIAPSSDIIITDSPRSSFPTICVQVNALK